VSWIIESVLEADVDPSAVFALYADPATWSRWGHNATWARSEGPLVEGGIVDVRAGYGTVYHCLIRRFEQGRALELVVRPALLTIINVYEVDPAPIGARIRHALEISGPLAPIARLGLRRMYQRMLDAEVADVARIAANPGDPAEVERPPTQVSKPERVWHGIGKAMRGGRERQSR
jgi:hypothetical protein